MVTKRRQRQHTKTAGLNATRSKINIPFTPKTSHPKSSNTMIARPRNVICWYDCHRTICNSVTGSAPAAPNIAMSVGIILQPGSTTEPLASRHLLSGSSAADTHKHNLCFHRVGWQRLVHVKQCTDNVKFINTLPRTQQDKGEPFNRGAQWQCVKLRF